MSETAAVEQVAAEHLREWFTAVERGFGEEARAVDVDYWRAVGDDDRRFAVRDEGRVVATCANEPFRLTVPGGEVPMAGVTAVAVSPTHRRRGLLRAMMRRLLDDAVERGEPVAGLWASESSIYGRFGFGPAAAARTFDIDVRAVELVARPDEPPVRFRTTEEALAELPGIYEAVRPTVPGMLDMSTARWGWVRLDPEHWRDGAGKRFVVVCGGDLGYAAYRIKQDWGDGVPNNRLVVEALTARDLDAWAALWRFLLGVDLVSAVSAPSRPVDEPLDLLLDDPRRTRPRLWLDTLHVRLLDVPSALSARGFDADGAVTVGLRDDHGPAAGRYRIAAEGGVGHCTRVGGGADVTLHARDFARCYLGGESLRRLARAGLVDVERPAAVATLDRMLRSEPAPWCPFEF